MTSPVTGAVLAVDRYRPGAALDRFLAARDEHCRFPGCRRPVWRVRRRPHHRRRPRRPHLPPQPRPPLPRPPHPETPHRLDCRTGLSGRAGVDQPTGRKHTDRPEPVVRFIAQRRGPHGDDSMMREPWLFAADAPPGTPGAPPFERLPRIRPHSLGERRGRNSWDEARA